MEASVDFKEKLLENVLLSKNFSKVVSSIPKKTDLIVIRGKLTDKRLKLYKKIHKAFPDAVFIYQSFTVDSTSEVLKYFSRAKYSQVSFMADLCRAKEIKVKGEVCAELDVGRVYVYNAGIIDQSKFVKTPLHINTEYLHQIIKYFKPRCVASINDSNGVVFDACSKLKIKSFTHTIYPALSDRMTRGYPSFKPNRNKLV